MSDDEDGDDVAAAKGVGREKASRWLRDHHVTYVPEALLDDDCEFVFALRLVEHKVSPCQVKRVAEREPADVRAEAMVSSARVKAGEVWRCHRQYYNTPPPEDAESTATNVN